MAVGEATNPPLAPGQERYNAMLAASDQPTALAWKQDKAQQLLRGGFSPKEVDAYFGDQAPSSPSVDAYVKTNLGVAQANDPAVPTTLHHDDMAKAFAGGLGMSDLGIPFTKGRNQWTPEQGDGWGSVIANQAGQSLGDLPVAAAGYFSGLVAGTAAGSETGPGAALTGAAAAGFGGGAAPQAVREVLLDAYNHDQIHSAKDFVQVVSGGIVRTLKAGVGSMVGNVAGGAAGGKLAEAGAGKLLSGAGGAAANASAGVAAGAAMNGKLPDKSDFVAAGVTALMMHGFGEVAGHMYNGVFTPSSQALKVQNNLENIYRRTGMNPNDAVARSATDPVIRQEILSQDVNGETNPTKLRTMAGNDPSPMPNPGAMRNITPAAGELDQFGNPKTGPEPVKLRNGQELNPANPVDRFIGLTTKLEGSGDHAISPKGAVGRHQIMPGTARQYMGADYDVSKLMDPAENERVAKVIGADLVRRYPNDEVAQVVAYNAGPGRANQLLTKGPGTRLEAELDPTVRGGVRYTSVDSGRDESFLPLETQKYIANARRIGSGKISEGPGSSGGPPEGNFPDPSLHGPNVPEEVAGGGGGSEPPPREPPALEGPEPEKPEVNWWKSAHEDDLVDEVMANVGEQPERKGTPVSRQIERYMSELAPARNIDTRLIEQGILDRNKDFGVEDAFRQTYASDTRAGVFSKWGGIDPITMELKPGGATDTVALEEMRRNGGDIQGLKAWMIASRALDLERRGINSGFDPKVVAAMRDGDSKASKSMEAKYGDAFKIMDQVNDRVLDYYRESGMTTPERVAAMKEKSPLGFVSFRRVAGDDESFNQAQSRNKFGVVDPLKRMEGSDRQITDPIVAMLDNRKMMVKMADRNRAIGQIIALAEADKTGAIAKDLGLLKLEDMATTAAPNEGFKQYGMDKSDAEDIMPEVLAQRNWGKMDPNDFMYFRNGVAERWTTSDPDLAEMIKKVASPQEADLLIKGANMIAKVSRAGISMDPTFPVKVMLRHQDTAFILDPLHPPPYITAFKGLMGVLTKDRDYQELMAKGGLGAAMVEMDTDHLQRDMTDVFEKTGVLDKVTNSFQHPLQWFQAIHEAMDAAPRLGYYKTAVAQGIDPLKAATMSRTAYLDFSEKATSAVANTMSTQVPFFRATILGMKQAWQSFDTATPGEKAGMAGRFATAAAVKTLKAATIGILGSNLLLYGINYFLDKQLPDGEKWQDIPRWVRDQYFITPPINGVRMHLKYPAFVGFPMGGLMNRVLDNMAANDPHAFDDLMGAFMTDFMPPLIPPAIAAPLENITNHSFHSGRSLTPGYLDKASGFMQYTENTTEPAKALARALGPTGMNVPLLNHTSPVQIENLVDGWTGSVGLAAMHAVNAPWHHTLKPDLADVPFVGSFFLRNSGTNNQALTDFASDMHDLEEAHTDFTMSMHQGNVNDVMAAARMGAPAYQSLAKLHDGVTRAVSVLRAINEDTTMTVDEKRQAYDEIMPQVTAMARAGVSLAQEAKKELKGMKTDAL